MELPDDSFEVLIESDVAKYKAEQRNKHLAQMEERKKLKNALDSQIRELCVAREAKKIEIVKDAERLKKDSKEYIKKIQLEKDKKAIASEKIRLSREKQIQEASERKRLQLETEMQNDKFELAKVKEELENEILRKQERRRVFKLNQTQIRKDNEKQNELRRIALEKEWQDDVARALEYRHKLEQEEKKRKDHLETMKKKSANNSNSYEDNVKAKLATKEKQEATMIEKYQKEAAEREDLKYKEQLKNIQRNRKEMFDALKDQLNAKKLKAQEEARENSAIVEQTKLLAKNLELDLEQEELRLYEKKLKYRSEILAQIQEQRARKIVENDATRMNGVEKKINSPLYKEIVANPELKKEVLEVFVQKNKKEETRKKSKPKSQVRENYFS